MAFIPCMTMTPKFDLWHPILHLEPVRSYLGGPLNHCAWAAPHYRNQALSCVASTFRHNMVMSGLCAAEHLLGKPIPIKASKYFFFYQRNNIRHRTLNLHIAKPNLIMNTTRYNLWTIGMCRAINTHQLGP